MSVEFTKAGEHRVQKYLKEVISAYKEGRTGLHTASSHIFVAMQHAAHDDPQLGRHMMNWIEAVKPPPLP